MIKHPLKTSLSGFLLLSFTFLGTSCSNPFGPKKMTEDEMKSKMAALEAENQALKNQSTMAQTGASTLPGTQPDAQNNAAPVASFTDIASVETKPMIDDLTQLHVFDGMGTEFKPYQPITRAEYVTWLFKAYNAIKSTDQIRMAPQLAPKFKDLPPTHPAYPYAQALASAGYSVGYEDGTFKPDKVLTREELVGMKVGVDYGKSITPTPHDTGDIAYSWKFSDAANIDRRYAPYVYQDFFQSGPRKGNILRAFGKVGTLNPKQSVLRHEAAASLWQIDPYGQTANWALTRPR